MEITAPTILEIGAILLAAATAGWLARRVHLPAVVGYLAVGLAISPFTPGWVADPQQLHILADIGVVLLLFEVGIEIDLFDFRREQRGLVWAAPLQMVITTLVGVAVGLATGIGPLAGAVLGLAVAFSSSVVVLNITRSKRRRTDPPTEKALVGWAILQDVAGVVLFGFLLAALSAGERPWYLSLLGLAAFIGLAWVAAWVLPRALRAVHEDKDLFLVVTIGAGLALAGLGGFVFGIPMALAAFIAGLAISESHESAEARRRILPFRDLFAILFFVALGTLIDPSRFPEAFPWLGVVLVMVVVAKAAVVYVLARVTRLKANPLQLTVGLAQIGEFSFVLASVSLAAGAIDAVLYTAILAAVALSIAVSTVAVRFVRPSESAPRRVPAPPDVRAFRVRRSHRTGDRIAVPTRQRASSPAATDLASTIAPAVSSDAREFILVIVHGTSPVPAASGSVAHAWRPSRRSPASLSSCPRLRSRPAPAGRVTATNSALTHDSWIVRLVPWCQALRSRLPAWPAARAGSVGHVFQLALNGFQFRGSAAAAAALAPQPACGRRRCPDRPVQLIESLPERDRAHLGVRQRYNGKQRVPPGVPGQRLPESPSSTLESILTTPTWWVRSTTASARTA